MTKIIARLEHVLDTRLFDVIDEGFALAVAWPHTRHVAAKTRAAIDALAAEVPQHLSPLTESRQASTSNTRRHRLVGPAGLQAISRHLPHAA
ncbi:hypothetical protein RY831_19205 [Noviherbaspirillum sp. CPCC 100848]|uniref:Uncharacterized protein n=1 Tax=Noviherbaspirillum album TaxID=3080276 RepID=A0ABU6JCB7_9BURK|nr:hypothetical protein [Noviherbaspirillum sp. CPCC 100848]MEC4721298.1 hypothetical protein [Noviherbaspirillum sp. CPCC 100848]